MPRAGQLRERVTLLFPPQNLVSDGLGGFLPNSNQVTEEVWARVQPIQATERLFGARVVTTQAFRVSLRYRFDLTPAIRLTWRGQQIAVHSVVHNERSTETVLYGYAVS